MFLKYWKLFLDYMCWLALSVFVMVVIPEYYLIYAIIVFALLAFYFLVIFLCDNQLLYVPGIGCKDGKKTPLYLYIRNLLLMMISVGVPYLAGRIL